MSEKWNFSHRNPGKSGYSYTFCWKKGGQSYTWQRWKRGLFGTHIRTMPYRGSYPPLPPPPPSPRVALSIQNMDTVLPKTFGHLKGILYAWYFFLPYFTREVTHISLHTCPTWPGHLLLMLYNTCLILSTNPFYYPKDCSVSDQQCRPWSDAAFCSVWFGSTLFLQVCPRLLVNTVSYILLYGE